MEYNTDICIVLGLSIVIKLIVPLTIKHENLFFDRLFLYSNQP